MTVRGLRSSRRCPRRRLSAEDAGGRLVNLSKRSPGLRTRAPWRDLPERFGPWQTAQHRHNCWSEDGTYERLHQQLMGSADAQGELDWLVSADSTIVRAHQHAAGARRREDQGGELAEDTGGSVEPQAISARAR